MSYKKMQELSEYLDMEQEELDEYLSTLNVTKALALYEKVKNKTDVKTAVDVLYSVLLASGLGVSKEITENLSLDDEFREYALTLQTTKNKVVASVLKVIKEEKEDEDKEDLDVDLDKDLTSGGSEDFGIFGSIPMYTEEEEKFAFNIYDFCKMRLELYLYSRRYEPAVEKFLEYAETYKSEDRYGNDTWAQSKDPLIVRAITKLYSNYTTREEVVNVKKDEKLVELLEEMREVRDDISEHNMRLVISIAKSYMNYGLPLKDLIQEGSIGLDKAINKFDPSMGNRFSTFAVPWIRQAVSRAVANEGTTIKIPVHLSQRTTGIKRAMKSLLIEDEIESENASPEEIYKKCKELGYDYTLDNVKSYLKAIIISQPVSADKPVGEEEDNTLIDFLTSDTQEKPEEYAEKREAWDNLSNALENLGSGKTSYSKRNLTNNHDYYFKKLYFRKDDTKELISIILSNGMSYTGRGNPETTKAGEYEYYFGKDGRERFVEFVNKYGLDPKNITFLKKEDIVLSKNRREELVFKLRFGISDPFLDMFVKGRNYNNALFDEDDKSKEKENMTLARVGKLFEVTRERIRQIEAKFTPKLAHSLGKRPQKVCATQHIYMGENFKQNIYDAFNIYLPKRRDYIPIIPKNNIIEVDDNGYITPLRIGSITICLKHADTNIGRDIRIIVHPTLRQSISEYCSNKNKTLELKPEDNKKDNQ